MQQKRTKQKSTMIFNDNVQFLYEACKSRRWDVAEVHLRFANKTQLHQVSCMASKDNDVVAVEYLMENGADNVQQIACTAASNGHDDIVQRMMRDHADIDAQSVAAAAAEGGNLDIIARLSSKHDLDGE